MGKMIFKIILLTTLLIVLGFFISGPIFTNSEINEKIDQLSQNKNDYSGEVDFSSKDFLTLPSIVGKYLKRSIKANVAPRKIAEIKMTGYERIDINSDWKSTEVTLNYSLTAPEFIWVSENTELGILWSKKISSLINLRAEFTSKFLSSITTDHDKGVKLDQNYLGLYILNSVFCPTVLLPNQNLHWTGKSKYSAEVLLWYKSTSINAEFYFDQSGNLEKVVSYDMFLPNVIESKKEKFSLFLANFQDYNGITIPTYLEYQWNFDNNDITVGRFNITSVKYK